MRIVFSSSGRYRIPGDLEPEILCNISLRLPQADRQALAEFLAPLFKVAIAVGGDTVHFDLQPYDPDEPVED